jgi:hypothetical protein
MVLSWTGVHHVRAVLPDVDLRPGDGLSVGVEHPAGHERRIAARLFGGAGAVLPARAVRHVERPEDGGLGRALVRVTAEQVDEHRQAEGVGEQDELRPLGEPARLGEEPDAGRPLLVGQAHLYREPVQVADEARRHLPHPRVRRCLHLGQHLAEEDGG